MPAHVTSTLNIIAVYRGHVHLIISARLMRIKMHCTVFPDACSVVRLRQVDLPHPTSLQNEADYRSPRRIGWICRLLWRMTQKIIVAEVKSSNDVYQCFSVQCTAAVHGLVELNAERLDRVGVQRGHCEKCSRSSSSCQE